VLLLQEEENVRAAQTAGKPSTLAEITMAQVQVLRVIMHSSDCAIGVNVA
jgi:hypothetical protein